MRRKAILLALAICILLSVGCSEKSLNDDSLENIKEKGELVIGLDDNFPPMGFRDNNGEIVGFDIDLAKELGERLGVKIVFKPVEWDGIVLNLINKNIDVIWNGLTITDDRKENINFSNAYLENRQIIIVNNDSKINSKEDLKDKMIGLQLESSSFIALEKDNEIMEVIKGIRQYTNNVEALMDLKAGRIDAVVVDEILGRYYIQQNLNQYKILDDDFGKELYGIGIRKEDVKLKEEIDKIMDEMKSDGTAAKISEIWFGEDILVK